VHGQPVCSWSISMKYAMKYQFTVCSWSIHCKLGLEAGTEAENVYHIGQVVKCRIIIVFPASRRINVSFIVSHNSKEHGIASHTWEMEDQI